MRVLLGFLTYLVAYDLARRLLVARLKSGQIGLTLFGLGWGLTVAALPLWLSVIGGAGLDPLTLALSSTILFVGVFVSARLLGRWLLRRLGG